MRVTVEPRDVGQPDLTRCTFWEVDPPPGTQVKRRSTVVLVVGPSPCVDPTTTTTEPVPAPEPSPGGN